MSDRNVFPPEAMNLLENLTTNSGDIEALLQLIENNTDELEAILQDVDDNTDIVESELQGVNSELDTIQTNTDNLEALLNSVITELQDIETDAESINSLLDELEDALASTATDQIRVDIIDEGDVATEATLSSVNDFLDAIEDALASTGTDELRVNVINQPISVDDNGGSLTVDTDAGPLDTLNALDFEVDADNSTTTPLGANAEFVGEWVAWGDYVGINISLFSDELGGVNDDGLDALTVEISSDGGATVDREIDIDFPPSEDIVNPTRGIEPFIPREGTHYRVRFQNGSTAQSVFRLNTIRLPIPVQRKEVPLEDTVTSNSIAQLVKAVIGAKDPSGEYSNIEADRFGNLRTTVDNVGREAYRYSPRGDVTLYGTQVTGSKVPQIDIQWHEEPSADDVLNTDGGNTGTYTQQNGAGVFNSGTGADDQYIAQTFQEIQYISGFEIQFAVTTSWTQPPTNAGDYATIGLSNGDDGFELGYKGTNFGIRYLSGGSEQAFIQQADFNLDKLDGNPTSEYRRDGEPIPIDTTTQNVWRIRFGWYGTAPTHIEVLAPDGHWVAAHRFDFTLDAFPQTETPNLPIRINLDKNSSDSTNIEFRSGAWYGGITANVAVAQQPDGDYVSDKASGQAFTEQELLTANETFTSDWIDTDGWESFEIQVVSDQPSAEDGVEIEFTDDVQSEAPQVRANSTFTYTQDQVDDDEALIAIIPTELDGLRVNYTNGAIGQNEFSFTLTLRTPIIPESTTLTDPINDTDLAQTVRAITAGEDESGEFDFIGRLEDALKVTLEDSNTQVAAEPDNTYDTVQTNIPDSDGGGPIQVLNPALVGRRQVKIGNEGSAPVFMGPDSSVTALSGYRIDTGEEEEFNLGEEADIWMVAEDATGGTTTHTLDPTAADTSGTATNPDNVTASDDVDAIYDAQGELIDAAGYDASGVQVRDDVANVQVGFEGAKSSTAGTKTITFQEVESNQITNGTSVTTSQNVTSDSNSFYIASVGIIPSAAQVSSVTGLGLTWSRVTQEITGTQARVEVWKGTGTPTGDDVVTANFDQSVDVGVIGVTRYTGASSVFSNGTNTGTGTAWTVSTADSVVNGRTIGTALLVGRDTTNDPGGDDTEHLELTVANPNRATFAVQSRASTGGPSTTDGTWGESDEWVAVAIALEPEELDDPIMDVEYQVSGDPIGETTLTQTLTSTIDASYTVDVTADRAWTYTDIDNTTVTVTLSNADTLDADIDHIFIEFTEVDQGSAQRVALYEGGIQ